MGMIRSFYDNKWGRETLRRFCSCVVLSFLRAVGRSENWGGRGANSNVVVITCPPPRGWKKITDLTKSGGSPPFLGPCSSPFYFTLKARSFESKPCVLLRCTYSQLSFPWSLDKMAFSRYLSALGFWNIEFVKSSLMNWNFCLVWTRFLLPV